MAHVLHSMLTLVVIVSLSPHALGQTPGEVKPQADSLTGTETGRIETFIEIVADKLKSKEERNLACGKLLGLTSKWPETVRQADLERLANVILDANEDTTLVESLSLVYTALTAHENNRQLLIPSVAINALDSKQESIIVRAFWIIRVGTLRPADATRLRNISTQGNTFAKLAVASKNSDVDALVELAKVGNGEVVSIALGDLWAFTHDAGRVVPLIVRFQSRLAQKAILEEKLSPENPNSRTSTADHLRALGSALKLYDITDEFPVDSAIGLASLLLDKKDDTSRRTAYGQLTLIAKADDDIRSQLVGRNIHKLLLEAAAGEMNNALKMASKECQNAIQTPHNKRVFLRTGHLLKQPEPKKTDFLFKPESRDVPSFIEPPIKKPYDFFLESAETASPKKP